MKLRENAKTFKDNDKMLFGPKFEEVITKSLISKNNLRMLFGSLKEQEISSANKDFRKHQPFQKTQLFRARENRWRGIFLQAGQSISNSGTKKKGTNTF